MGITFRCKHCQNFFIALIKKTKYCSEKCRREYYYKKKRVPIVIKKCKVCGKVFKTNIKIQLFCNRLCKNIYHRQGIIKIKNCLFCNKQFECTNNTKKYCNVICYTKAKRLRGKKYYESTEKKI